METSYSLLGAHLTSLPPNLSPDITHLFLTRNEITVLPPSLSNLQRLECLQLTFNFLEALPQEIGELTSLKALYVAFNLLRSIPEEIGQLSSLRELMLTANQLESVPQSISQLINLEELFISCNRLNELPNLSRMVKLRILLASGNRLTRIPDGTLNLIHLQRLNLNSNRITEIPDNLTRLSHLRELYLSRNLLREIPFSFHSFTHLRDLDLSHNQITEVPISLTSLTGLERLNVSHNPLRELPESLITMPAFQRLNPFEIFTPQEVIGEFCENDIVNTLIETGHKTSIKIWLQKLKLTQEFKSRTEHVKEQLKKILTWIASEKDHDQQKLALVTIEESNRACGDAALNGYNDLSLLMMMSMTPNMELEELKRLVLGFHLRNRLREVARKVIQEFKLGDEVETVLFLEIRLKNFLNLPIETDAMNHGNMAGISPECLENIKRALLKEIDSPEKRARILSCSIIWRKRLESFPHFQQIKALLESKKEAFCKQVEGREERFQKEFEENDRTLWNPYYHLTLNLSDT